MNILLYVRQYYNIFCKDSINVPKYHFDWYERLSPVRMRRGHHNILYEIDSFDCVLIRSVDFGIPIDATRLMSGVWLIIIDPRRQLPTYIPFDSEAFALVLYDDP
jgi:hypothetical protein